MFQLIITYCYPAQTKIDKLKWLGIYRKPYNGSFLGWQVLCSTAIFEEALCSATAGWRMCMGCCYCFCSFASPSASAFLSPSIFLVASAFVVVVLCASVFFVCYATSYCVLLRPASSACYYYSFRCSFSSCFKCWGIWNMTCFQNHCGNCDPTQKRRKKGRDVPF